jgi:iron(III) transport system substrate-binding protein
MIVRVYDRARFNMNRAMKFLSLFLSGVVLLITGCKRGGPSGAGGSAGPVVLYTSVDEPYVRPLVAEFTRQTGIDVTLVTDSEASKGVGLDDKLRAEKDHPKADVWWSNECFLTINLADDGMLAPYDSPAAADIPSRFKDKDHRWAGSVLRVRTLVWSTRHDHGPRPTGLQDLLRPDLKEQIAIARPTAGTTGGQVAALYTLWGKPRAEDYFRGLRRNGVALVGGNSVVADSVGRGDLWLGICDNDDAAHALSEDGKLEMILPDQGEGQVGTLAMPCTAALVKDAPHTEAAKKLIDFILSAKTDQQLIDAKFAWCSSRNPAGKGKFMRVNYAAVARAMPRAIQDATYILDGR